eukprot:10081021-Alexandrium_andersonii.AAC.1
MIAGATSRKTCRFRLMAPSQVSSSFADANHLSMFRRWRQRPNCSLAIADSWPRPSRTDARS